MSKAVIFIIKIFKKNMNVNINIFFIIVTKKLGFYIIIHKNSIKSCIKMNKIVILLILKMNINM
jgi:hypothetical protein